MMSFFKDALLPILLLSPILATLHLFLITAKDLKLVRVISLVYSILIFIISILLYLNFNSSAFGLEMFQFSFQINWIRSLNLNFTYGVDGVSLFFIILTTFLIPLCILSSWESIKFRFKEFVIFLFLIEFLLLNVFTVLDILLFYVFFESVLIPMFIMIGVWGSRNRKIHASYQFFIYTFFGSVFMLLGIIYIYSQVGSTDYRLLLTKEFLPHVQLLLWLSFFASFAVKIPMVPVHIWLPEAHVEAPTAGSVLLAGILLKLGTYGLIRFSLPLFPYATHYFTPLVLVISVVSIVYSSCTTLRQIDLKKIIAYSSVAHMNLVTIGIFSNSLNGLEGALALMLSHGLVSSGLFLCVGVLYDRYATRLIKYYGGLVNFMPLFGFVFTVFSLANMGFPGTSAFVGEILIFSGAFSINTLSAVLACVSVIFSAGYSVWLLNRVMYGPVSNKIYKFADLNSREFFYLIIISLLVLLFGIYPNGVLETMHSSCSLILQASLCWNFPKTISSGSEAILFENTISPYMLSLALETVNLHPTNLGLEAFVLSYEKNPEPKEVFLLHYLFSDAWIEAHRILLTAEGQTDQLVYLDELAKIPNRTILEQLSSVKKS